MRLDFSTRHVAGKLLNTADHLSRSPDQSVEDETTLQKDVKHLFT